MKISIISLVLVFLLNSCSHIQTRSPAQETPAEPSAFLVDKQVGIQIEDFQNLVEESLVWRAKSVAFAQANVNDLGKKLLNNVQMLELYDSIKKYLVLREKILASAYLYQELVDSYNYIHLNAGKRTYEASGSIFSKPKSSGSSLNILYLDPLDEKGRDLLLRMKISLAASLILYDNYMIGIYPYQKQKKIRKMLNDDLPGQSSELEKITENFFNLSNRTKAHHGVELFNSDLELKKEHNIPTDSRELYLESLIQQSAFYQYIATGKRSSIEEKGVRAFMDRMFDHIRKTRDSMVFIASKILGNTMGFISFREGKLKNISDTEKENIVNKMRPLDIMLEKTPFRLTDHLIPGYYGHAAIWVGSEAELTALGVWDDPAIQPYQAQIRDGKRIIEALRSGVQINSLEHFLNIDDLLVLRDRTLTEELKKEFLVRAFKQIGKEYDFNFDVETDKRIVCSEIVYTVFHDISWPTKKAMGRYTISPDNIADKAIGSDSSPPALEPVIMYRKGALEEGDYLSKLRKLLKK